MFKAIRRSILFGLASYALISGCPVIGGILTFLAVGTALEDWADERLPELTRRHRDRANQDLTGAEVRSRNS